MVLLADVRDYLKTFNLFEGYGVGKIDASKKNILGVYPLRTGRHKTIGANTQKYDAKGVSLLIHGNTNATETERLANRLYEALNGAEGGSIAGKRVYIIELQQDCPIDVGTAERGDTAGSDIYEFVIEVIFYIERED